ncbi:MAG: hypothetical protein PVG30_05150 [Gammaproteobacteria bacterium]|jgi:hypothetical protein
MQTNYADNVFINCPFDNRYKSLFHATIFSIIDCGFVPRCALEIHDGSEIRLNNIIKIIADCKFGIHDISRIELNHNKLPRANMPFELGISLTMRVKS